MKRNQKETLSQALKRIGAKARKPNFGAICPNVTAIILKNGPSRDGH